MLNSSLPGSAAPTKALKNWRYGILALPCLVALSLSLAGCATSNSAGYSSHPPAYQPPPQAPKRARIDRPELRLSPEPLLGNSRLHALQRAESRYRAVAAAGGWPSLRTGARFQPGDGDPRLPYLRRRLALSSDLPAWGEGHPDRTPATEVVEALKRFQERHGLRPTGIVDSETMNALNVSANSRLAQLRTNIARIQNSISSLTSARRYVVVNIPAFQLEAVEGQRVVQRHRVIVGRPDRQTPEVDGQIQNLNFYPYWHVPESIVRRDLLPRVQKNPDYLIEQRIRVLKEWQGAEIPLHRIDWRSPATPQLKFRQDAGPSNALGVVRLDMPNKHAVYMHDTPMKRLFKQRRRAFSAGCVRVDGVLDLVTWALRDVPGSNKAGVNRIVANGDQIDIALPAPIPVRFVYLTAWASPDGRVSFRPDLYGRDQKISMASLSTKRKSGTNVSVSP